MYHILRSSARPLLVLSDAQLCELDSGMQRLDVRTDASRPSDFSHYTRAQLNIATRVVRKAKTNAFLDMWNCCNNQSAVLYRDIVIQPLIAQFAQSDLSRSL